MSGNVEEWCSDMFGTYPTLPQTNPLGPSGQNHVARGGTYHSNYGTPKMCRVSYRKSYTLTDWPWVGFRLAHPREETQEEKEWFEANQWRDLLLLAMNSNTRSIGWGNTKGQVTGLGAIYYYDKSFYFGGLNNNIFNGNGILMIGRDNYSISNCPDCKVYIGNWSKGLKSGTGACYDETGKLIYYGKFKNDKPVGTYPSTNFAGYTRQYGNAKDPSGDYFYIGEFNRDGKPDGTGFFIRKNGDMVFTTYKNGLREGKGIYIHSNGDIATEKWKNGVLTK